MLWALIWRKKTPEEVEEILNKRAEEGIKPRPLRKGLFGRYTKNALSAMKGAGYEN